MNKVLLVEDERILALALRHELQQRGYEVIGIATNAPDAIALARGQQPDYVIMDISIEGKLDGVQTADALAAFCTAPIIYLTGESDMKTRIRAMKAQNARAYLTKPGDVDLIQQELVLARKALVEAMRAR